MTQIIRKGVAENGPRSHALVIGVGHYRHFKDGAEDNTKLKLRGEQLTSPPISAGAFADWLLGPPGEGYQPPVAPLATIELLLSARDAAPMPYSRPDTGEVVTVETATSSNLKKAFTRWRDLVDVRPDDVALFFFSGHGLKRDSQILLLEDFGSDAKTPFDGAFNFDETWVGMARCEARRQYYFVDACQSLIPKALRQRMATDQAKALFEPEYSDHATPRGGGVFRGAAASTKAYARENQVSHFTTAVLNGLKGLGSDPTPQGDWVVSGGKLLSSIVEELDYLREKGEAPAQDPRGDGISPKDPIHVVGTDPPKVPYVLWCAPSKAHALARLSVHHGDAEIQARGPMAARWEIKLTPRTYSVGAAFDEGGPFDTYEGEFTVSTPRGASELRIEPRS